MRDDVAVHAGEVGGRDVAVEVRQRAARRGLQGAQIAGVEGLREGVDGVPDAGLVRVLGAGAGDDETGHAERGQDADPANVDATIQPRLPPRRRSFFVLGAVGRMRCGPAAGLVGLSFWSGT